MKRFRFFKKQSGLLAMGNPQTRMFFADEQYCGTPHFMFFGAYSRGVLQDFYKLYELTPDEFPIPFRLQLSEKSQLVDRKIIKCPDASRIMKPYLEEAQCVLLDQEIESPHEAQQMRGETHWQVSPTRVVEYDRCREPLRRDEFIFVDPGILPELKLRKLKLMYEDRGRPMLLVDENDVFVGLIMPTI